MAFDITEADPAAAGMSARRLERIADHIERRYIEPGKIAGCQVAVARRGRLAWFRSFGSADLERDRPMADDTIFRIYSMTKPICGAALMTLYERGHFQLNDPVSRWIPELGSVKVREVDPDGHERLVEPRRPITVRHAMMHMTGLGMTWFERRARQGGPGLGFPEGLTLETLCRELAEEPLGFHPGERWFYSVSTDVCARLVEVMSGQRFDDYLRAELFEPLGMVDTDFWVPPEQAHRLAACYGRAPDKTLRLIDDPARSRYLRRPTFLSGGGGLVSTTADYLRFCLAMAAGGVLDGTRILGRRTVELMTMNHLPGGGQLADVVAPGTYGETGFDGVGFGLTVATSVGERETGVIGSRGDWYWGGAASTIFWVDPTEDLVVVFMTQLMPSGTFNFRGQLKALVYPAIDD